MGLRSSVIIDLFLGFALSWYKAKKDTKMVAYINKIIAVKEAGGDVDDHMAKVAEFLKGDKKPDYKDLIDRINAEVDELHRRATGGDDPGELGSDPAQ